MAMNPQVAAYKAQVDPILVELGQTFDNIAGDYDRQAAKITQLQAIIDAGSSTLDPEATAALADLVTSSRTLADRAKALADKVPDEVVPNT